MKILFVFSHSLQKPFTGAIPDELNVILTGADRALAHYAGEGWIVYAIAPSQRDRPPQVATEQAKYTLALFPEIFSVLVPHGGKLWRVDRDRDRDVTTKYLNLRGRFDPPSPGAIEYALIINEADPEECWVVGDSAIAEDCAINAGCNFMNGDIWRMRFTPGVHKIEIDSIAQLEFLEPKTKGLYQ